MNRRLFIQSATGLIAAASFERLAAQAPPAPAVKTVRTNVLEIGYHESGDAARLSGHPAPRLSRRCACL